VLVKKDAIISGGLAYWRRQFFAVSCEKSGLRTGWHISVFWNFSLTVLHINILIFVFISLPHYTNTSVSDFGNFMECAILLSG
jgi:hypothetical protein